MKTVPGLYAQPEAADEAEGVPRNPKPQLNRADNLVSVPKRFNFQQSPQPHKESQCAIL